jgi:hypothetical protein
MTESVNSRKFSDKSRAKGKHKPLFNFPLKPILRMRKKKSDNRHKIFDAFNDKFSANNLMINFPKEVDKIYCANPKEFFDHYDVFGVWLSKKLLGTSGKKILDLGGKKMLNGILSLTHEVTSLVLELPDDEFSNARYIVADGANRKNLQANFASKSFDIFTSTVSLHTMGLTRYGDELNPNAMIDFVTELDRIMRDEADLIFTLTYGKNFLKFNQGWVFDLSAIKEIFSGWQLVEYFIDNASCPNPVAYETRFTKDPDTSRYEFGNHRTIFLHFRRGIA